MYATDRVWRETGHRSETEKEDHQESLRRETRNVDWEERREAILGRGDEEERQG